VVEAARSRRILLDNRHRTTVGPPDRLEAFAHGMARHGRERKQKAASSGFGGYCTVQRSLQPTTVAGWVCAVTTSATAWAHGETITDHQKWRRES
jgi:hypothetical protein